MGEQFLVNTYTDNWQREPDILPTADGGFVFLWSSYYNQYDGGVETYYIAGQRYDASGGRDGSEFVLNAVDGGASTTPAMASLQGGRYALAFAYSPDGILGQTGIWTATVGADDAPRSAPVAADAGLKGLFETSAPSIAATRDGYVVFYTGDGTSGRFDETYYRRFDGDGDPIGQARLLSAKVHEFDQGDVMSATLSNGRVVALWNSEATVDDGTDDGANELRATLFDSRGRVLESDFHLTTNIGGAGSETGKDDFDVAPMASGGFVVSQLAYGSARDDASLFHITMRAFDKDGDATTRAITVHETDEAAYGTRIATLATGDVVVVWDQRPEASDSGKDVMARVMTAEGKAISDVFEVGVDFTSYDTQESPVVRGLEGGGFVVGYVHDNLDGDDDGIAGRIFGRGTSGDDALRVDESGEMAGLEGDDRLTGDAGRNVLSGGDGADRLRGGAGADTLIGGAGADRLWGGPGSDDFVLASADGARDRIYRFAGGDEIVLEKDAFGGIGPAGDLAGKRFAVIGEDRITEADRILYDRDKQVLFYDPDGSGGEARVALARFYDHSHHVMADDILIV